MYRKLFIPDFDHLLRTPADEGRKDNIRESGSARRLMSETQLDQHSNPPPSVFTHTYRPHFPTSPQDCKISVLATSKNGNGLVHTLSPSILPCSSSQPSSCLCLLR